MFTEHHQQPAPREKLGTQQRTTQSLCRSGDEARGSLGRGGRAAEAPPDPRGPGERPGSRPPRAPFTPSPARRLCSSSLAQCRLPGPRAVHAPPRLARLLRCCPPPPQSAGGLARGSLANPPALSARGTSRTPDLHESVPVASLPSPRRLAGPRLRPLRPGPAGPPAHGARPGPQSARQAGLRPLPGSTVSTSTDGSALCAPSRAAASTGSKRRGRNRPPLSLVPDFRGQVAA